MFSACHAQRLKHSYLEFPPQTGSSLGYLHNKRWGTYQVFTLQRGNITSTWRQLLVLLRNIFRLYQRGRRAELKEKKKKILPKVFQATSSPHALSSEVVGGGRRHVCDCADGFVGELCSLKKKKKKEENNSLFWAWSAQRGGTASPPYPLLKLICLPT